MGDPVPVRLRRLIVQEIPRNVRGGRRRPRACLVHRNQEGLVPIPLRIPAFRNLLFALFVSTIGSNVQGTAQSWFILELTGSAATLGIARALATAPYLLLMLHAGALADRHEARNVVVVAQIASGCVAVTLGIVVLSGSRELWLVLALGTLAGAASALGWPATQALVYSVVDRPMIGSAIALNSAQSNLSGMIGPVIAGTAITIGGLAFTFLGNAATCLFAAFGVNKIAVNPTIPHVHTSSASADLVDGLRFAAAHRDVLVIVSLATIPAIFLFNYSAVLPIFARDILRVGPSGLGWMLAAVSAGAFASALTMAASRPRAALGRSMVLAIAAMGGTTVLLGASSSFLVSLIALFINGAAQIAYGLFAVTLIHAKSPDRYRGRMLALYGMIASGLAPAGSIALGFAAERLGAAPATMAAGLLALVCLAVGIASDPQLLHMRSKPLP